MPVYSLYSFHRTFIPGFEYLTPSGFSPCFVYTFFRNVYFFFMGSDPGVFFVKKQAIQLFTTATLLKQDHSFYNKSPTSHSPNSSAISTCETFYIIFQIPPLTHLQHHMENTLHNLHLPSKH